MGTTKRWRKKGEYHAEINSSTGYGVADIHEDRRQDTESEDVSIHASQQTIPDQVCSFSVSVYPPKHYYICTYTGNIAGI